MPDISKKAHSMPSSPIRRLVPYADKAAAENAQQQKQQLLPQRQLQAAGAYRPQGGVGQQEAGQHDLGGGIVAQKHLAGDKQHHHLH